MKTTVIIFGHGNKLFTYLGYAIESMKNADRKSEAGTKELITDAIAGVYYL